MGDSELPSSKGKLATASLAILLLALSLSISTPHSFCAYVQKWQIDYDSPEKYLVPGEQSRISSDQTINSLRAKLGASKGLDGLKSLFLWMRQTFSTYSEGGKSIGKVTIDQLLGTKNVSGCHDWGLVFSGVARYLGYPAIMVDTAGIAWAEQFKAGKTSSYSGHVFVEIYVTSNWILVDSTTGEFVRKYQPSNPAIPITKKQIEEKGYYAILKGRDTWDYGVKEPAALHREMQSFALSADLAGLEIPSYLVEQLSSLASTTSVTSSASSGLETTSFTDTKTTVTFPSQVQTSWLYVVPFLVIAAIFATMILLRKRDQESRHSSERH